MSQPAPKNNLMQLLLIGVVVYLGFTLIMPRNEGPALTTEQLKEQYAKALEGNRPSEILKTGAPYSSRLRTAADEKSGPERAALLGEARTIDFNLADSQRKQAEANKNFDTAVMAYQAFDRLYQEAPDTEIGARALASRKATQVLATQLPKSPLIQVGYNVIDGIVSLTGRIPWFSYWFAAILMALIVRFAVWPLSAKQILGFKRMAQLQPMIKELQGKYQGAELQTRIAKLYQRYGINPLAGCWPMLIQMPIFIWVFYCMNAYRFEFQNGTFLWVNESVHRMAPAIIAPNLGERDLPLVLLYGISMVVTSLVTPTDPQTARQSKMMGIIIAVIFTVMMVFWPFPSAFIVYWISINVVSTAQSIYMGRMTLPPLQEIPEHLQKPGLFGGLAPKEGKHGSASAELKPREKTGAPVLHKPKGGKQKRRK
jgi:YidC/Oxa1 family membrane protein insertase